MAKNIMKNTYNKIILGLATVFAIFGMASVSFAATPILNLDPSPVTTTSTASFSVFYDMNGDILTSVAVRYGTNTLMTSQTTSQSPVAKSGTLKFSANGLTSGTLYYFEAIGVSSGGTVTSSRYTFTTVGVVKPTIQTNPTPTSITSNSATLSGFYSDNGSPLSNLMFEYGPSTSLGYTQNVSYGKSGTVSANISGLSNGTKYWYRLSGTNAGGTVNGSTYYFVTQGYTPTNNCVINNFAPNTYSINSGNTVYISWNTTNCTNATLSPSGYQSTNRTNYAVYPNSTTTYTLNAYNGSTSDSRQFTVTVGNYNPNYNCRIDYFDSSTYNVKSGSPAYLSWDSSNCSYLTLSPIGYDSDSESRYRVYPSYPSTTYRLRGPNGATDSVTIYVDRNNNGGGGNGGCLGCSNGNDRPLVTTNSVSNVGTNNAILHGYANGNGKTIDIWFEYGTTPNLSSSTSKNYGGYITNANGSLGGLYPNTTYYYRLVASNSYGTTYGNIMSFATKSSTVYTNYIENSTNRTNNTNNNTINNNSNTDNSNSNDNGGEYVDNGQNSNGLSASAGSAGFSLIPQTFLGWLILVLVILAAVIIIRNIMDNKYHDRGI
jgi:hypothetical protein